ncbi:MAG: 50S ribosomal protein L18 [Verrucomicrobia bacterium]|nr:50S ribosomal protein L18 [Verrucomicrobiota bacterium]
MRTQDKLRLKQLRHWRIRKKITGTAQRPRMSVTFTNEHIYVQFIDDTAGKTLSSTSTMSKAIKADGKVGANVVTAKRIGSVAAEAAKTIGISSVVFDRGGSRYHGKVKALADAARDAGLKF